MLSNTAGRVLNLPNACLVGYGDRSKLEATAGGGSQLTRRGITVPISPGEYAATTVTRLAEAGYRDLWTAETAGADAFTPLAVAAGLGFDGHLGTAIASVFSRGPGLLAMQAAALARLAPGRFDLGIGASSKFMTESWNAAAFDRPLARVRDTVRFLKRALAGEKVSETFETFSVRSFQLDAPPEVVPPLLVAALRPAMLRMAAAEADGVILNWLSATDVESVLATAYPEGASSATVAARVFVCCSEDAATVRDAARRLVSTYLTVPTYEAFQRWLGRATLDPMWSAWAAGDRVAATAQVPDQVVDELIVHGPLDQCVAHLERYRAAGVTVPIVKLLDLGTGRDLADDAAQLGAAWGRHTP